MIVRRLPSKQRNANLTRTTDRGALGRFALLLLCGLVLAGGFLYAGGLHFAALKYGYENEKLRRERDRLTEEQRRFLLQREEAASPVRLERVARQLGMQAVQPAQIDPLGAARKRQPEKETPALNHAAVSTSLDKSKASAAKTKKKRRLAPPK